MPMVMTSLLNWLVTMMRVVTVLTTIQLTSMAQDGTTEDATYGDVTVNIGDTIVATGDIAFTTSEAISQTFSVASNLTLANGGLTNAGTVASSNSASTTRVDDINIGTVAGANSLLLDHRFSDCFDRQSACLSEVRFRVGLIRLYQTL